MKRNLVPLLGIAFVVAIAATGIFYGLFVGKLRDAEASATRQTIVVAARSVDRGQKLKSEDVRLSPWAGALPPGSFQRVEEAVGQTVYQPVVENEPITKARTSMGGEKSHEGTIPEGMRAISVRVSESAGLMPFLHAGHKVDVQVVDLRRNEPAVRTLLQNVEVLSVQATELNGNPAAFPVVTLLVTPRDADRVALADSAAKIRLLLRNQKDAPEAARPAVEMTSVLTDRVPAWRAASRPAAPAPSAPSAQVTLDVHLWNARATFLDDVTSRLTSPPVTAPMQIAALQRGVDPAVLLAQQEILGTEKLVAQDRQEVSLRAGATWKAANGSACGLRIQFVPNVAGGGAALRLRVQPELTTMLGDGTASRRVVAVTALVAPAAAGGR